MSILMLSIIHYQKIYVISMSLYFEENIRKKITNFYIIALLVFNFTNSKVISNQSN